MKTMLRCRCGHRILAKDVLRADPDVRAFGSHYVWIKYRCSRCKHIGEHFVKEEKWDWSILQRDKNELSDTERDRFSSLSPITSEQILDFHRALDEIDRVTDRTFDTRDVR
jgi:DNA-directed RNA polymerase subunit RPC12/RpoP